MIAPAPPGTERRPGCTDDCMMVMALVPGLVGRRDVILHSPEIHEAYGAIGGGTGRVVRTGPLTVDLRADRVYVGGREIELSVTEWALLADLTAHAGIVRFKEHLLEQCWGPEYSRDFKLLRTNISRLRQRLGEAGSLIQNRLTRGYVLLEEPPIDTGPPLTIRAPRVWSQNFEACRECGTTERPHRSHGRCTRCQHKAEKAHRQLGARGAGWAS